MKYLWICPFRISLVAVIKSHHFEMWKGQKISNSELCVSTFPAFQTIFWGWCLGCTAKKGMMWPFENIFHRTNTVKLILWIKTMGCCGLACVVWLKSCECSKRKSVLIVGNSRMMCLLQKFLNLTYLWTFFIFYQTEWTCWVFLLHVRS